MKSIQVIGTNGKGSVCIYLANALSKNNKCGVFTSPHIKDIRERVCIYSNGKATKIDYLPPIKDIYSEFNVLLKYAQKFFTCCDYCIYEAGLGGRLDPTTKLNHDILIITQISMDHMHILGNTLEEIASEKAAAIMQNQVVFCAPQDETVEEIIKQRCLQVNAKLILTDKKYSGSQVNLELAKACAEYIGVFDFDFSKVLIPARLERIGNKLFDVCHNPASVRLLVENVSQNYMGEELNVFAAVSCSKDYMKIIEILSGLNADFFCVELNDKRLLNPEILKNAFNKFGKAAKCIPPDEIDSYYDQDRLNIYCGSFYLISQVY